MIDGSEINNVVKNLQKDVYKDQRNRQDIKGEGSISGQDELSN